MRTEDLARSDELTGTGSLITYFIVRFFGSIAIGVATSLVLSAVGVTPRVADEIGRAIMLGLVFSIRLSWNRKFRWIEVRDASLLTLLFLVIMLARSYWKIHY